MSISIPRRAAVLPLLLGLTLLVGACGSSSKSSSTATPASGTA